MRAGGRPAGGPRWPGWRASCNMGYVDAVRDGGPSFAGRALARMREWPALRQCEPDGGAGVALVAGSQQVVHLHRAGEAEVCLTWPVIARLSAALADSGITGIFPGDDWLRLPLLSDQDVERLGCLASVAIHRAGAEGEDRYLSACPESASARFALGCSQPALR
jgi:luciferase-like monooxygenase